MPKTPLKIDTRHDPQFYIRTEAIESPRSRLALAAKMAPTYGGPEYVFIFGYRSVRGITLLTPEFTRLAIANDNPKTDAKKLAESKDIEACIADIEENGFVGGPEVADFLRYQAMHPRQRDSFLDNEFLDMVKRSERFDWFSPLHYCDPCGPFLEILRARGNRYQWSRELDSTDPRGQVDIATYVRPN